jgi:hypothetical protein
MIAATLAISTGSASAHVPFPAPPRHRASCGTRPVPALCKLHWFVRRTWSLQDARGLRRSRYWWSAERNPQDAPWLEQREAWRFRAQRITAIPLHPWTAAWFADAMCVHHFEGAWNAVDPSGTYFGGMQEDVPFQQAYGPAFYARYGMADRWPPRDQLVAAWRAWRRRGWEPWPNTAAMCGLL